eukprot:c10238_g1_i1.p1 GENE.c10238_g1_i1~~c10238_g1_i1.p1  ORF type:complete len:405 (-),score=0.58 c10238_g1_i1:43-1140(-)
MIKKVHDISGMHWPGLNPFLFLAYHLDKYPASPDGKIPSNLLRGRDIGSDFGGKDGFNMYHGVSGVPGFPQHPHTGFETITILRSGLCDHSDSLGAQARFGEGDAQWLTTGKGISHCEIFPLVHKDKPNTLDLFQIWLNSPSYLKKKDPSFSMMWGESHTIVKQPFVNTNPGETCEGSQVGASIRIIHGSINGVKGPEAPTSSYASAEGAEVAVALISIPAGGQKVVLQRVNDDKKAKITRMLYVFEGNELLVNGTTKIGKRKALEVDHTADVELTSSLLINNENNIEILLLQGREIEEPVVQRGPFVTNTQQELADKFSEYRRTQFGGWPWDSDEPTHDGKGRFARLPSGEMFLPNTHSSQVNL